MRTALPLAWWTALQAATVIRSMRFNADPDADHDRTRRVGTLKGQLTEADGAIKRLPALFHSNCRPIATPFESEVI
jgi:hypothetical protein